MQSEIKEFIPGGKMVNTKEQFPDLLGMDEDEPKKKGGKGKKKKNKGAVTT